MHMCAEQLSSIGKFIVDVGDIVISLGDVQRVLLSSASSTKEFVKVFDGVDRLVKDFQKTNKNGSNCNVISKKIPFIQRTR